MRHASVLCALALLGCGPADVSGDWHGSWRTDFDIADGDMDMFLDQDGEDIRGDVDLGGTICVNDATLDGVVTGHDFDATFSNGVGEVELSGTVAAAGDRIEGSFDVTAGLCAGWEGHFELRR
jgi:hypothetical protein